MDSKKCKMRDDFINQTRIYVKSLPRDYYPLLLGSAIFFIVSIFVPNVKYLYLSPTRPWSIFTYMFVYDGSGNIELFILLFFFYLIASYRFSDVWRLKMSRFLTVSMFLIAIISGICWVILFPKSQVYGQSGVVYALYGMVFIISLLSPLSYFGVLVNSLKQRPNENLINSSITLASAGIFVGIIALVLFCKNSFFNVQIGIGYQLHMISFLLGIIVGTFGFYNISKLMKFKKSMLPE